MPLRDFLVRAFRNFSQFRSQPSITAQEFLSCLTQSLQENTHSSEALLGDGFMQFEKQIWQQIKDLEAMQENGQFNNPHRFLGIQAPEGGYWYNFTPESFLECATEGYLGGWELGDDSGRDFVPGPCAAFDEQGNHQIVDPQSLPRPVREIKSFTWDEVRQFFWFGQHYE